MSTGNMLPLYLNSKFCFFRYSFIHSFWPFL